MLSDSHLSLHEQVRPSRCGQYLPFSDLQSSAMSQQSKWRERCVLPTLWTTVVNTGTPQVDVQVSSSQFLGGSSMHNGASVTTTLDGCRFDELGTLRGSNATSLAVLNTHLLATIVTVRHVPTVALSGSTFEDISDGVDITGAGTVTVTSSAFRASPVVVQGTASVTLTGAACFVDAGSPVIGVTQTVTLKVVVVCLVEP